MPEVKQTFPYSKAIMDGLKIIHEKQEYVGVDQNNFGKIVSLEKVDDKIEVIFETVEKE